MRRIASIMTVALAALALAGPVSANEAFRWTDTHEIDNVFSCGVVEDTTASIDGTAYFDADGNWVMDILRFSYAASYTDPATGATVSYRTRQVVTADPSDISLMGQGAFVRAQGGARLLDVGKLTVNPADGSTIFRSAKALALDDPSVFDRYDAAICSLF